MFESKEVQPHNSADIAQQVAKDAFKTGKITVDEFEELIGLHAKEISLRILPTIPGQSDCLTTASTYFGQLDPDGTNMAVLGFQRAIIEELRARRSLEPTRGHNRWSISRIASGFSHIPKVVKSQVASEIAAVAVSAAVVTGGVYSWDFVYRLYQAPETRIIQGCENLVDGVKIPDNIEVKDPEKIKEACRTLARDIVLNRMDSNLFAYPEKLSFYGYLLGMGVALVTGAWKIHSLGRKGYNSLRYGFIPRSIEGQTSP